MDVILIEPGLIRTAFADNVVKQMAEIPQQDGPYAKFNAQVRKATEEAYVTPPLSWLSGKPEDVARAILFLLEPDNYVTGQVLTVDGGLNLKM
mgnify:CR=1 FL=1